jgi:AraC-like DNA-binding protein
MELGFFDTILRGGAVGIFTLIAVILVSKQNNDPLMWVGAAFFICAIGHTIDNSPGWRLISPDRGDIFNFVAVSATPLLWAFLMGLFSDRSGQFWRRLIPFGVMTCVNVSAWTLAHRLQMQGFPSLWLVHIAMNVALMAHILWILARDIGGDLIEARRRLRGPVIVATSLYVFGMALADIFDGFVHGVPKWPLLQSGALFGLAVGSGWAFLQAGSVFWGRETSPPETIPAATQSAIVDNLLLARLKTALSDGQIWKREGLTIGALAAELSVPEYRLRRLINENLGHRNFADFINSNRIEAAMVALGQPILNPPSITQLAYELGFASIGPFNRAFKRVTGVAPTVWRTGKLAETSKS